MVNIIELPGEANPLTAESLIATLAAGVGSSQHHRTASTQQLDTWSTQPFYYDGLAVGTILRQKVLKLVPNEIVIACLCRPFPTDRCSYTSNQPHQERSRQVLAKGKQKVWELLELYSISY